MFLFNHSEHDFSRKKTHTHTHTILHRNHGKLPRNIGEIIEIEQQPVKRTKEREHSTRAEISMRPACQKQAGWGLHTRRGFAADTEIFG